MNQINTEQLIDLLRVMAEEILAAKDQLTELDAAIGDGDLGVTMTLGFRAIQQALQETADLDISGVFSKCGMAFADHAASTFGALMSTMFTRAARTVKGKELITPIEAAEILSAATEGVQQRGKAQLGDKTVLDAMIPARDAMNKAVQGGANLQDALDAALQAARQGAEDTIALKSKAGRSGWLGDRTVGVKDPGAAAFVLLLSSAKKYLDKML